MLMSWMLGKDGQVEVACQLFDQSGVIRYNPLVWQQFEDFYNRKDTFRF